jgi:uncharacterized damage-inducible protein DinB
MLLQSHIDVLQQAVSLLKEIQTENYQLAMQPHLSGSIGKHIRHVIDHYLALEQGLVDGLVDYNQRHRNSNIEASPSVALDSLNAIINWLENITSEQLENSVTVRSEVSISQTLNIQCHSTLAREILFVSSHAIHHFSLISVARSLQGYEVSQYFGYAPATISYLTGR